MHRVWRLSTDRCVSRGEAYDASGKGTRAICGAEVIGATITYYLALRGVAATVVERCGLAMAELLVDGEAHSIDLTPFAPQRALPQNLPHPV
jgi:hypothetical protein